MDFYLSPEKESSDKKGETLEVTSGNPKLGGEIGFISFKDIHAFVGKGVDQIESGNE
jgi:hypothetical protein